MATDPLTWKQTRQRLREDRARLATVLSQSGREPIALSLHPGMICVLLFRLSNHFFRRGRGQCSRLLWQLNLMLTGADISPRSDIAGGLVITCPAGIAIACDAGRNLTVMPLAGIGSELGRHENIGAGAGLPMLGDEVVMEPHCGVLGPVRIGDRVRIAACTSVIDDVEADTRVAGPEPRFARRRMAT